MKRGSDVQKEPRGKSPLSHIGRVLELSSRDRFARGAKIFPPADFCPGVIHFARALYSFHPPPSFSLVRPRSPFVTVAVDCCHNHSSPRDSPCVTRGTFPTTLRAGTDFAATTLRVVFPDRVRRPRWTSSSYYGHHLITSALPATSLLLFFRPHFGSDFIFY